MSGIVTLGIDLAKNVFALHGVDDAGKPVLVRPNVARSALVEVVAKLPPCLIGMEACSGAHHWARLFAQHGHTVRLMAPKFVAPYRLSGKRGKSDAADAQAICEAVARPHMRFVPIKTLDQQGQLMVHRVRQGFVQQRTATINRIRGLLSEVGIVLPFKAATVWREAYRYLESFGMAPRFRPDSIPQTATGVSRAAGFIALQMVCSGGPRGDFPRICVPGGHTHSGSRACPA
jgi:transposase